MGADTADEASQPARLGQWERVEAVPFTSPAGDLCAFPPASTPVVDRVSKRTTETLPDGSPRRQEYKGPLRVRLTNAITGRSILRDLSGRAVATYDESGAYDFSIHGPAAVGFRSDYGDSLPPGYYGPWQS